MTHTNGRDTDHSLVTVETSSDPNLVTKEISSDPVNDVFDDERNVNESHLHLASCLELALPQADNENEATTIVTTTTSGDNIQLSTSHIRSCSQNLLEILHRHVIVSV